MQEAGEEIVSEVTEHAEQALAHTAPRGHHIIQHQLGTLREDFDSCFMTVSETQAQLGQ